MDQYKLPAYIHTDTGRAYLSFSTDIQGLWSAGYVEWIDGRIPTYNYPDPVVSGQCCIHHAAFNLSAAMKAEKRS